MREELKVYIVETTQRGIHIYKRFAPGHVGRWRNIVSVDDLDEADYLIVNGFPVGVQLHFPREKILYFKTEPDEFHFGDGIWNLLPLDSHTFHNSGGNMLQQWDILKTYDELKAEPFPSKTRDLSWITSNYGDGSQGPEIQILTGHRLRMNFLRRFLRQYPGGPLHLYGKRLTTRVYQVLCNKGQLYDKWDGLADYRYTLAFENASEPGYWTGKLSDAFLAGCMPIFWGCPNLEKFFPKDSFVRVDITREDAPERVVEIAKSDRREQNLAVLEEAKQLCLDKYNVWPMLHRIVNEVHQRQLLKPRPTRRGQEQKCLPGHWEGN